MEVRSAAKRRYFAYGINESLLELAKKLREAEVRVNGRSLQTAIPQNDVFSGVLSTVDGGRLQFIARRNHMMDSYQTSKFVNSSNAVVTTNNVAEVVASDRFCASPILDAEKHVAEVPLNVTPKKLSQPNRNGPSLWPFLSSIKTSADAEHVRFLEKNQQFYSVYKKSRIIEGYTEDLSESDFEIVIDNAVDTLLQTREPNVLLSQQSHSSKNESSASAAVSPVSLPMNTDVDVQSTFETDDTSTAIPPAQPVVSKRYAAAIANPRRFRCELCPYSTNNRSHVRRHHLSVHSDARPYRCYVCGKEFARCENAKVHMVSRHPDVPYSVDRLRSSVFVEPTINFPKPIRKNLTASTSTDSSSVSGTIAAVPLQQDVSRCGMASQWPSDSSGAELGRAVLGGHQVISPWLNFPKIEPKPDQSLPVLGHGSTGSRLLEGGIPQSIFQAQTNAVLNVQPLLGSVCPTQQGPTSLVDIKPAVYPVADRHVCLYCQFVCQSATELATHIATSHTALGPTLHATPVSNPGYVVLQTAAPIFLFPPPNPVLPNRSQVELGYPPILPKLQSSDDYKTQNEAFAGQQSLTAAAGTTHRSPQNVPNTKAASVGSLSTSSTLPCTPAKVQESQSSGTTPVSSEGKRERRRQFKTFYCSRCPDRAPFRYEKSFEKHVLQHRLEDRAERPQKIASKVM